MQVCRDMVAHLASHSFAMSTSLIEVTHCKTLQHVVTRCNIYIIRTSFIEVRLHSVISCGICTSKLEQLQAICIQVSNIMCAMVKGLYLYMAHSHPTIIGNQCGLHNSHNGRTGDVLLVMGFIASICQWHCDTMGWIKGKSTGNMSVSASNRRFSDVFCECSRFSVSSCWLPMGFLPCFFHAMMESQLLPHHNRGRDAHPSACGTSRCRPFFPQEWLGPAWKKWMNSMVLDVWGRYR